MGEPEKVETRDDKWKRLVHNLAELSVHAGLFGSVMDHYPLVVQENWEQRLDEMNEWADRQIAEIQQFGEAFDEDEDET